MIRRKFLKCMAFAALATVFPHIPLARERRTLLVSSSKESAQRYIHDTLTLGFQVSRELMVYGREVPELQRALASRYLTDPNAWYLMDDS